MLKKFVSSLACIALLAGCSSASSSSADASEQASDIVENLEMSDHVEEVKDRVIQGLLFLDDTMISDASLYMANDQSADVVGVFKVQDGQMDTVKEKLEDYLSTTKTQMENYYPDEVFKVDNAIFMNNDDTIVLIVTDDIEAAKTQAESILN